MIYMILQWTWGILQNMAGGFLTLCLCSRRHEWYHHAYVTYWHRSGGLSLGMFLFLEEEVPEIPNDTLNKWRPRLLYHEYGHTFQSIILGPFYFFVIALPSLLWANLPLWKRFRAKNHYDYYRFYTEKWADNWGQKAIKEKNSKAI